MTGNGAICARYILKHRNLCRRFYWDCKVKEIITGTNTFAGRVLFPQGQSGLCRAQSRPLSLDARGERSALLHGKFALSKRGLQVQ
jgi:hypothetical protein